ARDDPGGLRVAARRGVRVERAVGGGLVEPADELAVPDADDVGVALGGRFAEAPHERLRGRAPAEVLQPLPAGLANALFLLLDVRHRVKTPAIAGGEMVAGPLPMLAP